MHGLMMDRPLLVADILTYAEDMHRASGVVSSTVEGGRHYQSYPEMAARCRRLARALRALGLGPGDRVATLAWNGYRHMELYYGIPGIGAVCHTINPRLSGEQMGYIVNHAADRALFVDLTFVPLVEKLASQFPADLTYVILTDAAHMPDTSLANALCYEDLLAAQDDDFAWPDLEETTAAGLCYTSGTTGNPKGALYTHRSMVLHALMVGISMQGSMRPGQRVLPVVPLFHANAWGTAHAAPLTGATLVMPGPHLDGAAVFDLMHSERVCSAWGVPTVWLGLMQEIRSRGSIPQGFAEVVIGGSAAPTAMIADFEDRGVSVCHAWGMTEMSPIGTLGHLTPDYDDTPAAERLALKSKQGRRAFLVELKIVDEDGTALPHDGEAAGELFVRGPTIASAYYNDEAATAAAFDAEGWFGTGDVATICAQGFLSITDRAKDLIKSGGEWISSLDVENMAMAHGHVANCAVIAVPHPKWDERPVLIVVPSVDDPDPDSIRAHLAGHLAKWQLPDDILFVEALPLTATGKVSKLTLRRAYADHRLPQTD
ncbi:MAG: long-chain fatty acid--CoA ligase [Rhodobacteraceae bacterium]|nr:long-chain fatty acid--CoA ligase [Paracoccaceae bacterium]